MEQLADPAVLDRPLFEDRPASLIVAGRHQEGAPRDPRAEVRRHFARAAVFTSSARAWHADAVRIADVLPEDDEDRRFVVLYRAAAGLRWVEAIAALLGGAPERVRIGVADLAELRASSIAVETARGAA